MSNENKNTHSLLFGFSTDRQLLQSSSQKLEKGFYLLLTVLGTASFTYAGGFASSALSLNFNKHNSAWDNLTGLGDISWVIFSHPYLHFIYGVLLLLWGLSGTQKDYENLENRNKTLEEKIVELEKNENSLNGAIEEIAMLNAHLREKHEQLVKTWLKGSFSSLLGDNTHARVSIYYFYNDEFYILSRYSPNGTLGKIHRQKFKQNQGIISKVYRHLMWHENEIPSFEESPDSFYAFIKQKYGYEREQLEKYQMKTSRYFGQAIREAGVVIGILLFESIRAQDLHSEEQIHEIKEYCKDNWSHLCQFVRHGIEHDITVKYHDNVRTDQDVLGELKKDTNLDILNELKQTTGSL